MAADHEAKTVLMTADTVGGVWVYALELARALGACGTRVVLAAMGSPLSPAQRAAAEAIETLVIESRPCKLEWMENPWDEVDAAGRWLMGLERRYRPSIIHLNDFSHGALPWYAPVLVVGHSCVWSWFEAVRRSDPPAEWDAYRCRVTAGLRGADAVAAPTHWMLESLRKHYGAFSCAGVVYNARRAAIHRPLPARPFVLTAGRLWDEAKNVRVLDAVAARLPWPVFAAGSTRNPDGGEAQFEHVWTLGVLPEPTLARWMGGAAVYALPARYEPFGLTALEAARSGCALVLGDIPTLRELWCDAAVFVDPDDAGALASALRRVIDDEALRCDLARRARRRAVRFTVDRMARAYSRIYSDLLASRRPSAGGGRTRRTRPESRPINQEGVNA